MTIDILLIFTILSSAMIVWYGIPILRIVAYKRKLYDYPADERKIHKRFVSNLGGVALFVAFIVGFSASGYANNIAGYPYIVVALIILFFTGLKDDISILSPTTKLITEIIATIAVIFGSGLQIDHFYGFLGVEELPQIISVPLTVFTIIVVMNAYNLIDGIDGLAGGIGVLSSIFFGIGFLIAGMFTWTVVCLFLIAPLIVFLIFNSEPAKIFMGDSGSLTFGFLLSLLAVQFTSLSGIESYEVLLGNTSPVFAAVFLVLPLYDTLRVYIRRVSKRKSPFQPDKDHIHHILLDLGFNHKKSSIILYTSTLIIILITIASSLLFDVYVMMIFFFIAIFLFLPTFGVKRGIIYRLGLNTSRLFPASLQISPKSALKNNEADTKNKLK